MSKTSLRHLLKVSDFSLEECQKIILKAIQIKKKKKSFESQLKQKTLLLLFEKPSLRTRLSFETAMTQLGGHAIFYSIKDSPLGKKENIQDTAKCASRFVDFIAARVFRRQDLRQLAEHSEVPVINMLDDFGHPCQILGDFLTIQEKRKTLSNLKLSYFGDAHNNVTYDLMRAASLFGWKMDVACPSGEEFSPEMEVTAEAQKLATQTKAVIRVLHDPMEAAQDADVIYTDSWMSYGIPPEQEEERKKVFMPFQVNEALLKKAKPNVLFMNCLPAMRGYEQTAEVIDGPHSVVFDQAENRLHIQKSILLFLAGKF